MGRMISQVSVHGKNFNVVIALGAVNMINVKLCVLVVLNDLYPFILHLKDTAVSNNFY